MHTRKRGFTLIELLTVIAIIGILAAIIVPTVSKVRDSAKKAKCMSNVRQITLALVNIASQDKSQAFPVNQSIAGEGQGAWAWDVQRRVSSELVNQAGRETFYCPSSSMLANFTIKDLFEFQGQQDFSVTSYVLLITGTKQILPDYLSAKVLPTYKLGTREVPASQRALVVDAVISDGSGLDSFRNVSGGLPNNVSNHMDHTGDRPAGAHTGYVDAHVKWRPFSQSPRNDVLAGFSLKSSGTNPKFWF